MALSDYRPDDSLRYEELSTTHAAWDSRGLGIGLLIEPTDVNSLRLSLTIMTGSWWESSKIILRMPILHCVFITKNKTKTCYLDIPYRKDIRKQSLTNCLISQLLNFKIESLIIETRKHKTMSFAWYTATKCTNRGEKTEFFKSTRRHAKDTTWSVVIFTTVL